MPVASTEGALLGHRLTGIMGQFSRMSSYSGGKVVLDFFMMLILVSRVKPAGLLGQVVSAELRG